MCEAKFCFVCGKGLKMRYPGGDPENGPAGLRCPDEHQTVQEVVEDQRWETFRQVLEEEIIDDPGEIGPDGDIIRYPDAVVDAALVVQGGMIERSMLWDKWCEEQEADFQAHQEDELEVPAAVRESVAAVARELEEKGTREGLVSPEQELVRFMKELKDQE